MEKHINASKLYFDFCKNRKVDCYPVNVSIFNLYLLSLAQRRKSIGVIDSKIKAISYFFSHFLGCGSVANHYNVIQMKYNEQVNLTQTSKC